MRPLIDGSRALLRGYRYLVGFLLLNFALAWVGAAPFRAGASAVLGHSLLGQRLVNGFDLGVVVDMLMRPELGQGFGGAGLLGAVLFALASLVFMPGVLQAYAAGGCVPRETFFAACGRNLWRFVRLALLFAAAGAILAAGLGLAGAGLVKAANRSTTEQLPFWLGLGSLLVALVLLTLLRLWFDLAQAHVVVRDQKAVRRSLAAAFRQLRVSGGRLLSAYLLVSVLALAVLAGGLVAWRLLVPSRSVLGAFFVGQGALLLLLAARFWQRATAVAAMRVD